MANEKKPILNRNSERIPRGLPRGASIISVSLSFQLQYSMVDVRCSFFLQHENNLALYETCILTSVS